MYFWEAALVLLKCFILEYIARSETGLEIRKKKEHYQKVGEVKQTSRVREVAKQRNMGHYVARGLGFESWDLT